MTKRVLLNGTNDEKIMTCLRAAGWYEGRSVDITEAAKFYTSNGITLSESAECFLREYYGIAGGWFFNEPEGAKLNRSPDIEFMLYPKHDQWDKEYIDEDSAEFIESVLSFAKEPVVYVGDIGYYYPALVYIGVSGKIYTAHSFDDIIHCYDSVPELLGYDFCHAEEWNSVSMK